MHLELQQAAVHSPAKGASNEKEFVILTLGNFEQLLHGM